MHPSKMKRCKPKELTDRIVIFGVHPNYKRKPTKVYAFWASLYLMEQYPCVGDVVKVKVKTMYNGKLRTRKAPLYITDVKKWEEGMVKPTQLAVKLINGQYKNFQYEIEE